MLIEAARRAEAAAREMLALVNEGSASCAEMREMLEVSKATVAVVSAAQASAATSIAADQARPPSSEPASGSPSSSETTAAPDQTRLPEPV